MNICPGEDTLTQYKQQLSSVEEALKIATPENRTELQDLKEKLTEVINLLGGFPLQAECETFLNSEPEVAKEDEIEDEFVKFQKEISQLEGGASSQPADEEDTSSSEEDPVHDEFRSVLSSMEGKKCTAPFIREWGEKAYHNALIFSADLEDQDISNLQEIVVKVMFCNPTCDQMKPCPFFLDGHCKFSDDMCRYSHGYSVKFCDLEEYVLPNYSNVHRDSMCLAKYKDGLWYPVVIEKCLEDHKYCVKYTDTMSTDILAAHDILPLGSSSAYDDNSGDSSDEEFAYQPETEDPVVNEVTEINYEVVSPTSPMGTWEQHTKGIGSKLMAKMGYIWGQGLGKNSNGRLEPVEAIFIPKGLSLDKCAELRETDQLKSVEDRLQSEQTKEHRRVKHIEKNEVPESSIFAFLNKSLSTRDMGTENARKRSYTDTAASKSPSSDLNFQMYAVGEAIKKTRKEMDRLQQSVTRNADRNKSACSLIQQKVSVQTNILRELEAKERRISDELHKKKNHKKISVF